MIENLPGYDKVPEKPEPVADQSTARELFDKEYEKWVEWAEKDQSWVLDDKQKPSTMTFETFSPKTESMVLTKVQVNPNAIFSNPAAFSVALQNDICSISNVCNDKGQFLIQGIGPVYQVLKLNEKDFNEHRFKLWLMYDPFISLSMPASDVFNKQYVPENLQ